MKIFLSNQEKDLRRHLTSLKDKKVMPYAKNFLKERVNYIELNTNKSLEEVNSSFLFDYKIFPENIMSYLTQWKDENRRMEVGDTIVQQVYVPPARSFSQKMIFGVRVTEIIDLKNKKGFSYETLEGHVERGISTFTIESNSYKKIIFKIHTFSASGNLVAKILGPIFSVPYQAFCTKAALKNVKQIIESQSD